LTTRNPRIEKRLADFFDRCMNKNPKMRYDDAEMLLAAIKSQEATAQVKRSDSRALEAKPGRG
jgi:serine/threonine protein kinase